MYGIVLVSDFLEPAQRVGKTVTAVDSRTETLSYMKKKTTDAFSYIGRNGTNMILYMPAMAVPPTQQFPTCANGMRHHAGQ
jgi:hypothetical protein